MCTIWSAGEEGAEAEADQRVEASLKAKGEGGERGEEKEGVVVYVSYVSDLKAYVSIIVQMIF